MKPRSDKGKGKMPIAIVRCQSCWIKIRTPKPSLKRTCHACRLKRMALLERRKRKKNKSK